MLIRIGFEMVFDVPAPAPMLLMLGLRPEREASIRRPGGLTVEPEAPVEWYTDGFGNRAARLLAPAGRLILRDDLIVEDDGQPDPVAPDARQIPVQDLPPDVLVYLLSSRYCEVDRLSDIAWRLFGSTPEGWARVQAICDWVHQQCPVRLPVRPTDQDRPRRLRGAGRGLPRLQPPGADVLSLPEHPGPVRDRVPRRHRHPAPAPSDGLQRLVRGLPGRPMVHLRRPPQRPPDRPDPDGPRPRCGGRRADHVVRDDPAGEVRRLDRRGLREASSAACTERRTPVGWNATSQV